MSAILTAVVFVKSASGTNAINRIATVKLDDEEYMDFQYKSFNVSEGNLLEPNQANTIMLFVE
ncbi:12344_t:CDS:1, partial [Entrophospora sp. SA101]